MYSSSVVCEQQSDVTNEQEEDHGKKNTPPYCSFFAPARPPCNNYEHKKKHVCIPQATISMLLWQRIQPLLAAVLLVGVYFFTYYYYYYYYYYSVRK